VDVDDDDVPIAYIVIGSNSLPYPSLLVAAVVVVVLEYIDIDKTNK